MSKPQAPLEKLEQQGHELAQSGQAAHLRGRSEVRTAIGSLQLHALSQPAYFDAADPGINVSNFLVGRGRVAHREVAVVAVADGNYKDDATALASMAAIVEVAAVLGEPMPAEADIAPALRRAVLAANDRIRDVAAQPIGRRRFSTVVGDRTTLRGLGTSLLAVVIGPENVFIAQVGENVALVLRDGRARHLAVMHTLGRSAGFRAAVREDPELQMHSDVVNNILYGQEHVKMDITRLPVALADRLILGNALLASTLENGEPPPVERFAVTCAREHPYSAATIVDIRLIPA
jgi:serine/threonine protein phosphatase PrpC